MIVYSVESTRAIYKVAEFFVYSFLLVRLSEKQALQIRGKATVSGGMFSSLGVFKKPSCHVNKFLCLV